MDATEINQLAIKALTSKEAQSSLVKSLQSEMVKLVRLSRIHPNHYHDAVQEVLIQLLTCVKRYDPSLGDFLVYAKSSVNKLLKELSNPNRRRRGMVRSQGMDLDNVDLPAPPESTPQDVAELLVQLPSLHRDVVTDHFGIGKPRELSINQIAARRKLPNTKVKQVLSEAMTVLRSKGGEL